MGRLSHKNFLAGLRAAARSAQAQTVEYLTPEEVYAIADAIKNDPPQRLARSRDNDRNGERNSLLIITLFETGLRISEALSITPVKIQQQVRFEK